MLPSAHTSAHCLSTCSHLLCSPQELTGGQQPTRILCTGHSLGAAVSTLGESCLHTAVHLISMLGSTAGGLIVLYSMIVVLFPSLAGCFQSVPMYFDTLETPTGCC